MKKMGKSVVRIKIVHTQSRASYQSARSLQRECYARVWRQTTDITIIYQHSKWKTSTLTHTHINRHIEIRSHGRRKKEKWTRKKHANQSAHKMGKNRNTKISVCNEEKNTQRTRHLLIMYKKVEHFFPPTLYTVHTLKLCISASHQQHV